MDANGNGTKAAIRALRANESALAMVAQSKGLTLESLLAHLLEWEYQAASNGDAEARRDLRCRAINVKLQLHRTRSYASAARRIRRAVGHGDLTTEDATASLKMLELAQKIERTESEHDKRLDELEAIAGQLDSLTRVSDTEDAS